MCIPFKEDNIYALIKLLPNINLMLICRGGLTVNGGVKRHCDGLQQVLIGEALCPSLVP